MRLKENAMLFYYDGDQFLHDRTNIHSYTLDIRDRGTVKQKKGALKQIFIGRSA